MHLVLGRSESTRRTSTCLILCIEFTGAARFNKAKSPRRACCATCKRDANPHPPLSAGMKTLSKESPRPASAVKLAPGPHRNCMQKNIAAQPSARSLRFDHRRSQREGRLASDASERTGFRRGRLKSSAASRRESRAASFILDTMCARSNDATAFALESLVPAHVRNGTPRRAHRVRSTSDASKYRSAHCWAEEMTRRAGRR